MLDAGSWMGFRMPDVTLGPRDRFVSVRTCSKVPLQRKRKSQLPTVGDNNFTERSRILSQRRRDTEKNENKIEYIILDYFVTWPDPIKTPCLRASVRVILIPAKPALPDVPLKGQNRLKMVDTFRFTLPTGSHRTRRDPAPLLVSSPLRLCAFAFKNLDCIFRDGLHWAQNGGHASLCPPYRISQDTGGIKSAVDGKPSVRPGRLDGWFRFSPEGCQ